MMDCKKALVESEGDMEKAVDYLRKKGQKVAANRADREATEGVVVSKTNADHTYAAVVKINCETDFVAKNADFVAYAHSVLDLAVNNKVADIETLLAMDLNGRTVADTITDQTGKIGEKIELGAFAKVESAVTAAYIHSGNRLATIVALSKAGVANVNQLGHEVAMQVAAMAPVALDENDVPQDIIQREIEVGMEQARNEGKAEDMLEKIARGKLNKFYRESTLLNQDFIRENKKTVRQYLNEADKELTVVDFKRVALG
jgi:elongation factor Ts